MPFSINSSLVWCQKFAVFKRLMIKKLLTERTIKISADYWSVTISRYKTPAHHRRQNLIMLFCWLIPLSVSLTIVVYQEVAHVGSVANYTAGGDCGTADWLRHSVFYHFPTTVCGVGTLLVNIVAYFTMAFRMYGCQRVGSKNKRLLMRTVVMIVIFSLSWVPAFVIIDIVKKTGHCFVKWTAQVLLYLNTLTDPLIYVFSLKMIKRLVKHAKPNSIPRNYSRKVADIAIGRGNVVQMVSLSWKNSGIICSNYG